MVSPVCTYTSTTASLDNAKRLRTGLDYEVKNGCKNSKGDLYFHQFLSSQLAELGATAEEPLASKFQRLEKTAREYDNLDNSRRRILIRDTTTALDQYMVMYLKAQPKLPPPPPPPAEVLQPIGQTTVSPPPAPPPPPPAPAPAPKIETKAEYTLWEVQTCKLQDQLSSEFRPPSYTTLVPIVFDFEATGVHAKYAHPVEIAALSIATKSTFSRAIRLPEGKEMHPEATRVTGITTESVQDPSRDDFTKVYTDFIRFVEAEVQAHGPGAVPLLVGHNIQSE